ncbi:MAG: hypothetical protein K2P57_07805 [Burkholderiales bacterium]|nr:hypothetical protein [Burkholderiales bacterium]
MRLDEHHIDNLLDSIKRAGRSQEDSEAWVHALIDIQNSYEVIFNKLLPEVLVRTESSRNEREILWDIREELRHVEYHLNDVEGR